MLEEQQEELRAMFSKLEADRDMELEERQKLEEEIRMKQNEIEQVRNVVEEKDEETRRLQEEMSDAKRQLEVQLRKSRHANLCSKNLFFRENVVVIAFSELRLGSNERYGNSTFYGFF